MITVGLIKELGFISTVLKTPLTVELKSNLSDLIIIHIDKNLLEVSYKGHDIWKEIIESDTSFFGVESCDSIARIIYCLNKNDLESAKRLFFDQNRLNKLDKTSS